MSGVASHYRIATSAFERPFEGEKEKIPPKVIYFLSVEGDSTEYDYFNRLKTHVQAAYPSSRLEIVIQTPQHTGLNSPEAVYDLLLQCAELRDAKIKLRFFSSAFKKKYGKNLEAYFDPVRVTKEKLETFKQDLTALGIRYDLVNLVRGFGIVDGGVHPDDFFGMVIDRDRKTHTDPDQLVEIADECAKRNLRFCLSNPCFELWLYLHKVDVSKLSESEKQKMLANEGKGDQTYLARLVKGKCGHGKSISQTVFDRHYRKNLRRAVSFASHLETTMPSLMKKLGTNVGGLVAEILDFCETNRVAREIVRKKGSSNAEKDLHRQLQVLREQRDHA